MKLIDATKSAYKDMCEAYKDGFKDHWEIKESINFYKQSFRDFKYASKVFIRAAMGYVMFFIAPLFFPLAVLIRWRKK